MKITARNLAIFAFSVLILVSLACSQSLPSLPFLAPTPTPTATPIPLPPTIVETVPPIGSELSLQSPLTVYFSEKMDRASVESAFAADFTGGFLFSWIDDATLMLTPKAALPSNGKLTFTLAVAAKSAGGLGLLEPLSFSYPIAGPLRVAQVLPVSQAADVSPDSAVVVTFNQPVVPLGADAASLPAGLTLEPATQGSGEWLNTSTYIFHAEPALFGGTDYIARVNPQLVSTSGTALDPNSQDATWAFKTSLPAVLSITPTSESGVLDIDPTIEMTFNQPMERASIEASFAFSGPNGKFPGKFEWNEKSSVLTFKPSAMLARDTAYELTLGGQSRSLGGALLGSDVSVQYRTVANFGMGYTSFNSGETRPREKEVAVTFTAPVSEYKFDELEALVAISPEPPYSNFYRNNRTINLYGGFKPGVIYEVRFLASLKDKWGQELGQDYVFTFREPDAQPTLQFGSYLPAFFVRPEKPSAAVQAVNVSRVRISRGTFPLAEFFRYSSDYEYRQGYLPADLESWNESTNLVLNQNDPYEVKFTRRSGPLQTGLYYTDVTSDEVKNTYNAHPMLVSNINVTLKTSATQALVWAVDLRTQTPVSNVSLAVYDQNGEMITTGVTDEYGLWRGETPYSAEYNHIATTVVLAKPGDDLFGMAMANWNQGIAAYDFDLRGNSNGPRPLIYLYSERPVYRPGDTLHYRGIIRSQYNGRYSELGLGQLQVNLNDPNKKIDSQQRDVSDYGTFDGEFALPASAIPGGYSLNVSLDGDKYTEGQTLYFQVADYRKPEINLSVDLSPDPALNGQPLTGKIRAEYFFGAPVADLPFEWRLYSSRSYFSMSEFRTGVYRMDWLSTGSGSYPHQSGKGRTDADGNFSLPLNDIEVGDTTKLTLEITATESGGFPVSARDTLTMHPAKFYAGIRPDAWFGQAGTEQGFSLLTVDWTQKPVSQALKADFQKVRWERTQIQYGYDFKPVYTPVESKSVTTGADGKARVAFTPSEPGTYVLDVSGGGAHTQILLWVGGAENAVWPNLPYQQIKLTANQDKFKPGDSAEIFIPNEFNVPSLALVTVERSTLLDSQVVSIPAGGYTFRLPVTDEHAPNIYVSATLLGADNDFRQGYVNLPVEPSAFVLNVELKATPEKAKPGDRLTLDLKVTDSKGQPVQGEFSMAVVDLAALALADANSEDIVPAYYNIQPLGVRTGLTAAVYSQRYYNPAGGLGGGGGDQVLTIREKFPDTAYWKADIVTDGLGKAQVTLTLPDNLTTWQIDSRGLTQDTRVGQARVQVKTSKELLIRPSTPRFLVVGDHATLAANVNNTTGQPLEASVSLQANGFSLDDPATAEQKVQIPANGRIRVAWSGWVQDGDAVDAVFSVKSGSPSTSSGQGLQDASRPTDGPIPVLRYIAPQTFSTAGILAEAAARQEIIALPKTFQPLGGSLELELSPSLAAAILSELKARELPEKDWSNEQIVADFLPNLATYQALKDSGLSNSVLTQTTALNEESVRRLLANQDPSGGWAWTVGGQKTDPYLTAYALFALEQVPAELNIDVTSAMQRARDYLMSVQPMNGDVNPDDRWMVNRWVFHAYILQETGGVEASVFDNLYFNREKLDPWAKALLAQAMAANSPTDERIRELISDLQTHALRSATGVHWESVEGDWHNPNSPLFTTAVVVYSLAQRDPANPLLAEAVRYLAAQRGASRGWGSDYERAWIILALNRYMQATGELQGEFAFSAGLNGVPLAEGQASGTTNMTTVTATAPLTQINLNKANSLLISRQVGTGKLYYRAILNVDRPVESAPALNKGISLSRQFLTCNGKDCQPVTSYQLEPDASGRVKVQVTMTLPNDAYYLLLEDYIPAGADILDTSLKTSQQGEPSQSIQQVDPADPFGGGWGWWHFNRPQIYKDHLLWSADYLPAGTYVLTYTILPSLAGEYRVLPAHAWQAYFPEVQGTTAGTVFTIKP